MYDIKPLEEDWKKYNRKKKKPFYLLILLSSIFLLIALFIYNKKIVFDNYILNPNLDDKSILPFEAKTLINSGLLRIETDVIMKKSFEKAMKTNDILVDIPVLDLKDEFNNQSNSSNTQKVYLNIIETSSLTAYEDVEKRFLQSQDIDDAMFLARSYYKKGNYEKSELWAYEVNKLDDNLEEGLLIFIKSKVKLGRKNDALSILNTYLKKSDSKEAKNLLYKIENNKL
ncbi:hypothetical protein C9926_01235 [Sulfurovum lithotrophicum]|nr:hypothetical protein C9926_01235 [Sulfurovum lithotrophicum]